MPITPNALFKADRLEFLERLEPNSVQFVYVDPPWFTSSEAADFDPIEKAPEETQKYFTFISKTLQQCYRVLDKEGALLIQYEQRFGSNLRLILDQIFGRDCFLEQYIWPWRSVSPLGSHKKYDILLLYSKANSYKIPLRSLTKEEIKRRYPQKDNRGRYHLMHLFIPNKNDRGRPSFNYEWNGFRPPEKSHWRFSQERLEQLAEEGRITLENNKQPRMKVYYKEDFRVPIDLIWDHIPNFHPTTEWKYGEKFYASQRPLALLEQILTLGPQPGDIILDPFCGSGTSLHAAEKLGLRWLGCDLDHSAVNTTISRLQENFGLQSNEDYVVGDSKYLKGHSVLHNEYRELLTGLEDDLSYMIAKGESQYVEFKETAKWNRKYKRVDKGIIEKILKDAVAFMNSRKGGDILIGVMDDGTVVGLTEDYQAVNKQKNNKDGYSLFLTEKLRNALGESAVSLCEITFPTYLGTELCRIKVSPADRPVFYNKEFYLRDGSSSPPLNTQEAVEYAQRHWTQRIECALRR
ncbi:MAG: hypothetical protein CL609_07575 [Anaerolineaceae bacterium]|nr:hypothetical protein [Anaerolineaceae bacterium]